MARTVDAAAHERRRGEFLDAAQRLIASEGYAQMSVQDVLNEAGASRGAFYHYFEAKHDLLAAVVDRFAAAVGALLEPIAADAELSAPEQLRRVYAELSTPTGQEREQLVATLRVWYSDGNALVRQGFRAAIVERLAGVLRRIVARGMREGGFAAPDPDRAGLIVATLLQDLNDALADELFLPRSAPVDRREVERIVGAHVWAVERILGLPDGSTALVDTAALIAWADPGARPRERASPTDRRADSVTSDPRGEPQMPATVTFDTTVAATGRNTGIVVPDDAIEQLGAGRRPAVVVNVNGYEYRNTVGVMRGQHMISISAAVRRATGLRGGDPIHVTLTVAEGPREVVVPDDLAAALAAEPAAEAFFRQLSNSLQRYHVDNVEAAKAPETRQRRIDKALALFREGRGR